MTLNDILAGLPGTIVNRFSASNSAFWIAKCSDILSDLDTLCPGPWMVQDVRALPMQSGFIKKPNCISRIKSVRIELQDGTYISCEDCVKSFNEFGIELTKYASSKVISTSFNLDYIAGHAFDLVYADDPCVYSSQGVSSKLISFSKKTGGIGAIMSGDDYSDIIITDDSILPCGFVPIMPSRVFSRKPGTIFVSNVIVNGYIKTHKPSSLTDNLMLPSEWDHLIQAGLRWKAEVDMSPASSDAIVCGKMYNNAVKEYRSKMTMGQGKIHPSTFQGATIRTGDLW